MLIEEKMNKKIWKAGLFCFAIGLLPCAAEDRLYCEVQNDSIEKIICTFETLRKDEKREVTFFWHSETQPQDDRERTVALEANHGSVYDYRFLRGRAEGIWNVTATLTGSDGVTETEHNFLLSDNQLIGEKQ